MPPSTSTLPQGTLGFADADFPSLFDIPTETKFELMDREFRGILLDGPRTVDPAASQTVHYIGMRMDVEGRMNALEFFGKATLLTIRLDSGEIFAEWAFENDHKPTPVDYERLETEEGDLSGITYRLDLRRQFPEFPWEAGEICSRVILWNLRSNEVVTRIEGNEVHDPEVAVFLESKRQAVRASPEVDPDWGEWGFCAFELPESPPLPDEPGIRLKGARITVGTDDAKLLLHGSFHLPAPGRFQTGLPPVDPEFVGPHLPRPTAVLPIGILLMGDESSLPLLLQMKAPSFDAIDPDEPEPLVTGHFRLDLCQALPIDRFQTYAVHAVAGKSLSDPILMAWVNPRLLEGP